MAMRRRSVCLMCQARQSAFSRRRTSPSLHRGLQTVTTRPEDDGFLLAETPDGQKEEDGGPLLDVENTLRQWKLYSPIDDLRQAALGFDALWKRRDLRLEILRSLSNPWPDPPRAQPHLSRKVLLPEASAAVMPHVPHEAFRLRVKEAIGKKSIRLVLRQQLLRCEWPKEILRVIAVAMQDDKIGQALAALQEPIIRALYRCRGNVADPEVLRTLSAIITRFQYANLEVQPILVVMALKFAARARSLPAMKKYLKVIRERELQISSNVFRSVIAKCSIGHRGLGEIRNGRWTRKDLLQVLTGFDDAKHLPPEQQYHLGTFLVRSDWQYLHGWVAVLARCKDVEYVWAEWTLWKESEARINPKCLVHNGSGRVMNTKVRGDLWFIEQLTISGDMQKAWQAVKESGIGFRPIRTLIKDKLLESLEHATIWNEEVRAEIMEKYDRDLYKIEQALGVQWVATSDDGEGQHELFMDQEEALDALSNDSQGSEDEYGYPWEESPILREAEQPLHFAEEIATPEN